MARSLSEKTRLGAGRTRDAKRNRTRAGSASNKARVADPDLVMLLGEPEVRLLMRADHVDERELRAMLDAVAVQLRNNRHELGAGDEGSEAARSSGVVGR